MYAGKAWADAAQNTRSEHTISSSKSFLLLLLIVLSLASKGANSQDHPTHHSVVPLHKFQQGQWVEKVWGDPSRPGEPFVLRIHQDAGYIVFPHTHQIDENITIVKGTWSLGTGRRFDRSALEIMETGSFGIAPRNMVHFGWSKTETIDQVHGIGPFTSTVIDPVYELNGQGVFLLTSLLLPGTPTTSNPPGCFPFKVGAKARSERGQGIVIGARCSPYNELTQYWIRKPNGDRFWATLQELKTR